ncbi:MAG: DUF6438 domain-containing protein [Saprospiraceae bacterium]
MKTSLVYIAFILSLLECSTKKLALNQPGDKFFEMSKSPCFGRCPVYTVTVFQNGLMVLDAKDNMPWKGKYSNQMTPSELNSFKSTLKSLSIHHYKDEYREPIADAPATTITYYEGANSKKIFTNFLYPDSLQLFTEHLNTMVIKNDNWKKIVDQREIKEYLILLRPEAKLSEILQRYQDHEMMMVKRLDPATNQYWLVTAKINPGETEIFPKSLRADKDIQSAQLNNVLEQRQ